MIEDAEIGTASFICLPTLTLGFICFEAVEEIQQQSARSHSLEVRECLRLCIAIVFVELS